MNNENRKNENWKWAERPEMLPVKFVAALYVAENLLNGSYAEHGKSLMLKCKNKDFYFQNEGNNQPEVHF